MVEKVGIMPLRLAERVGGEGGGQGWTVCVCLCGGGAVNSASLVQNEEVHSCWQERRLNLPSDCVRDRPLSLFV